MIRNVTQLWHIKYRVFCSNSITFSCDGRTSFLERHKINQTCLIYTYVPISLEKFMIFSTIRSYYSTAINEKYEISIRWFAWNHPFASVVITSSSFQLIYMFDRRYHNISSEIALDKSPRSSALGYSSKDIYSMTTSLSLPQMHLISAKTNL